MISLKTLKDLNAQELDTYNRDVGVTIDDLRIEAIKWYKKLKELPQDIPLEILKEQARMNDGARLWIYQFFNLTEDDLK